MVINSFENGPFGVNTFLLTEGRDSILIDPGAGILPLLEKIKEQNLNLLSFLVTHPHIDHLDGVPLIRKIFPDTPGYISKDGASELSNIPYQARMFGVKNPGSLCFENELQAEGTLNIGPFSIRFCSTPGHCPGSLSYIVCGVLFPGDVLFRETVGRTDLQGGDTSLLFNSIKEKFFTLPDSMPVYPGHGPRTTIGHEKQYNPFLRFTDI